MILYLNSLLLQALLEFYGELMYKLKQSVGTNNSLKFMQFIKIILTYKKICYTCNINVFKTIACLVVNPL